MECKKDEAIRAKELAEKEIKEDFFGALAHAWEAKNLFPGLDGVTQLVEVLSTLAVSETEVNGEVNWYAVLDAQPSADEETLKKHYRLLAFSFHQDNNKSTPVADKTLEVVNEAWKLLSNTEERSKYDNKTRFLWNYMDMRRAVPTGCNAKPLSAFVTTCPHCKTQYIYDMQYWNKAVLCSTCTHSFFAIDSSSSSSSKHHPAA